MFGVKMNTEVSCELCQQDGGEVIYRNDFLRVVLVDDADYAGFCRVICNAHIKEMTDLAIAQRSALMMTVCKVEQAIRDIMRPDKINLASLGNMTPHLHWHVIPRYQNDKHFPQAIWGAAQRAGCVLLPNNWKATLITTLQAHLNASC
jgi:diadenosine tetraphosphate (Ap4A) HIT family hydrolase